MVTAVTTEEPLNNNVEAKVPPQEHDHLMASLVAPVRLIETTNIVASTPLSSQSAISDLERTASLRGITVLRGQVPKRPSGYGDEHVESYL